MTKHLCPHSTKQSCNSVICTVSVVRSPAHYTPNPTTALEIRVCHAHVSSSVGSSITQSDSSESNEQRVKIPANNQGGGEGILSKYLKIGSPEIVHVTSWKKAITKRLTEPGVELNSASLIVDRFFYYGHLPLPQGTTCICSMNQWRWSEAEQAGQASWFAIGWKSYDTPTSVNHVATCNPYNWSAIGWMSYDTPTSINHVATCNPYLPTLPQLY